MSKSNILWKLYKLEDITTDPAGLSFIMFWVVLAQFPGIARTLVWQSLGVHDQLKTL